MYLHSLAVELVTVEERAEKPQHFPVHFSTEPSPVTGQLVVSVGREVTAHHLNPNRGGKQDERNREVKAYQYETDMLIRPQFLSRAPTTDAVLLRVGGRGRSRVQGDTETIGGGSSWCKQAGRSLFLSW